MSRLYYPPKEKSPDFIIKLPFWGDVTIDVYRDRIVIDNYNNTTIDVPEEEIDTLIQALYLAKIAIGKSG